MSESFERTPFGWRIIRHAMRDRAAREHGDPSHRVSPMFDRWTAGLFPEVAAEAAQYVDARGIKEHSHLCAVNSSQGFAFNLFFPFRLDGCEMLGRVLSGPLGRELRVDGVEFEFCDRTDVLGEWAGDAPGDDEPHTTSDVAVLVTDLRSGERGGVLVEVKLSEGGFTPCTGATSRGNRTHDACESRARFFENPDRCYLRRTVRATKDRRYWHIFRTACGGQLDDAFPRASGDGCPFRGDHQQIMRNHALAFGMVQAGRWAFSAFGLVHHDENPDVVPAWHAYTAMTDLGGLFRLPATELLRQAPASGWWPSWREYIQARYDLRA